MDVKSRVVLITGGASGIGLGLAAYFLAAGSQVIVCGRREEKLREAKERYPRPITHCVDITVAEERVALCNFIHLEVQRVVGLLAVMSLTRFFVR